MYEQAIKLLLEDVTFCDNQMRLTQLKLDEHPISAKYISLYNDWQARRKEMLEAVEALQSMESVIKQKQFKEHARTLLKECGL